MLRRLLKSVRLREVLVLQGTPLFGFVLGAAPGEPLDLLLAARLCAASAPLVAALWMFNDWADFQADRADTRRARLNGVSARALLAQSVVLLVVSACACATLPHQAQGLAALIAGLGLVYSVPGFSAKGTPIAGALVHLAGGLAHFLMGRAVRGPIGAPSVWLGMFFALVFTGGHAVQEVQDHLADRRAGVRTAAVAFGPRRVFLFGCALFATAYALLVGLCAAHLAPRPVAGVAIAALATQATWSHQVLAGGLDPDAVARLRDRYRGLFALLGAALLAGTIAGWR